MKKLIPLRALREEAERALGNLKGVSWVGGNGFQEFFSIWMSGDCVEILFQNGVNPCDGTYRHFVEIRPRKMKAFFYDHCGFPQEKAIMEHNLRARGYAIEEKPLDWFNQSSLERCQTKDKSRLCFVG
jgi:hypothetical protein